MPTDACQLARVDDDFSLESLASANAASTHLGTIFLVITVATLALSDRRYLGQL